MRVRFSTIAEKATYEFSPALLLGHARERPDAPAIREKRLGRWQELSWSEYAQRVARAAHGLRGLGVEPGDRVAIHGENRPEWVIADLAMQGIGGVTVGIYPTSPAAEVEYLLGHSDSVVLIAEDEEQLDKAIAVRERLPALRKIVLIDPRNVRALDDPMVMTWEELEAGGGLDDFARTVDALDAVGHRDDRLHVGHHGPAQGRDAHARQPSGRPTPSGRVPHRPDTEILSYLPLCHVAERLSSVINGLGTGYVVNFGEGGESFPQDLRDVQPTFFPAVPRVWEKMLARSRSRWRTRRCSSAPPTGLDDRLGPAAGAEAEARAARPVGLRSRRRGGRARAALPARQARPPPRRAAVCGAAPIAPQVLEFFWALGVPVHESYGMTENTAVCTLMPFDDVRIGTVGRALEGVEVRIADDGEILTRSPAVFPGYFKNEDATAATIDRDGWLHTGDVGELDEHGHLTITDRKKDIIITAGGKNVSPSEIENELKVSPYVREAIVIGDRRKYLVALIGIEPDTVGDWAARRGLAFTTYGDLSRKDEVRALIGDRVEEVNRDFAQVETIKRFGLLEKELDHEDGELTATLKVKRRALEQRFERQIEELYV